MTSSMSYFDVNGRTKPDEPVDDHQRQPDRERPAMLADELAGLLPGAGLVVLGHAGM